MKKKWLIFVLSLISLASVVLNLYLYQKVQEENRVVEVVDGDTFQLKSGKRIRLLGVDAPEFDRCAGPQAKARLTELILGKRVTLKEETSEAFGRSLALVYVDRLFVNKIMLEEGWARTDYRKNSKREVLTTAFHQGQQEKLGIFSDLCRQAGEPPNPECLIKGNIDKNTYEKFYHLPGCKHYDQVIIELDIGEKYFCTEEEAQRSGFKKAGTCP